MSVLTKWIKCMGFVIFIIALFASSLGAVGGFGGGVIIKPAIDATGILPVSSVSFLSGCTALAMAISSLIQQRHNEIELRYRTTTPLAIGAVVGGLAGKRLFEYILATSQSEYFLGAVQAISLALITLGVLLYIFNKHRIKSDSVENAFSCICIGGLLGSISSFLGIGGGTSNMAILFFCFSMDAKTAAKNSLYIIIFSQAASIATAIFTNSVPPFQWLSLTLMIFGGISGAILGSHIAKKISNKSVELILKALLITMILVNSVNAVKFFF